MILMSQRVDLENLMPRTGRAFALGLGLALLVLAATIFAGWLTVRSLVRQQIAQRDAEGFHATTLMEQLDARNGPEGELLTTDEEIGFKAAMLASRLEGVMGIRFFTPELKFKDAVPGTIQPSPLSTEARAAVARLRPHSRYLPETPFNDIFIYLPQFATGAVARVPTLEITVPLHRPDGQELAGAAQFIVEGQTIAGEYARLDRHLALMAALFFAVAGALLTAMLWPAFRRVERLNRELGQRNERLLRANRELSLAARASALGAVSAHLMHGLKNPLASVSQFITSHGNGDPRTAQGGDEAQDALDAARRMQMLVEQTLEVLSDDRGEPGYDLALDELLDSVRKRVEPAATQRGVVLAVERTGTEDPTELPVLPSRVANLVSLILVNLLENAIQVTPSGRRVRLGASFAAASPTGTRELGGAVEHRSFRVEVRDQGPGFPEHLRAELFLPCRSTRQGGSGIGLAISKRLADHLGARLELKESSAAGCLFILDLPLRLSLDEPSRTSPADTSHP